jgi:TPR repeat protein
MVSSESTCCPLGTEYVAEHHACLAYRPERHCASGRLDACVEAARDLEGRDQVASGYAAELYRFACEQGAAAGCHGLGRMYLRGEGVSADPSRGLSLLARSCIQGATPACMELADRTLAADPSAPEATQLFAQACHRGESLACARYAEHLVAVDAAAALIADYYERACEGGNGASCLRALETQRAGGPVHPERERKLLERACAGDDAHGCALLGDAFLEGLIAPQSSLLAAKHYRRACEEGDGKACLQLGALTEQGDGVQRDVRAAYDLYVRACGAGLPSACERRTALSSLIATPPRRGNGALQRR